MTDLSTEQSAALVAAYDDPATLWHCLQPAIRFRALGLAEWEGKGTDMCRTVLTPAGSIVAQLCKEREESAGPSWQSKPFQASKGGWYWVESPNGVSFEFVTPGNWPDVITRIAGPVEADSVARQTKHHALAKRVDELENQQPHWRPIAECGELPDGRYLCLWVDNGAIFPTAHRGGHWETLEYHHIEATGRRPTHIEYLGHNPVAVPAAPESEGS